MRVSYNWDFPGLVDQIQAWLSEDLGTGDVTTNSTIAKDHQSVGIIHAKEDGVIAGLPVAEQVFHTIDTDITFQPEVKDGDYVHKGTVLAKVAGMTRHILIGERLALNLLQRMSGVATRTHQYVEQLEGLSVELVDTRKTTPGHRQLEKYAVRVGGGRNHRFGLYDAVMIKDNHIKASGGIAAAVERARGFIPHTTQIEVEAETLEQVREALAAKADIIMLDNMALEEMKTAVNLIKTTNPSVRIEASGGVTLERLRAIAETGVDMISVGALTSSIQALDISLDLNEKKGEHL